MGLKKLTHIRLFAQCLACRMCSVNANCYPERAASWLCAKVMRDQPGALMPRLLLQTLSEGH